MFTAKENKHCKTSLERLARGIKLTKWDVLKILPSEVPKGFYVTPRSGANYF